MSKKSKKKARRIRRQKMIRRAALWAAGSIAVLGLVVLLVTWLNDDAMVASVMAQLPTLSPTDTPVPTPTPSPSPTPVPTPEPVVEYEYLPVYKEGETVEKKIAITVDDCFQLENLKKIIATAYQNDGKLTLFPIGQNVERKGYDEVLKVAALQLGYEIENHTYSHERVFRLSQREMAEEIWKQRVALSKVLGVNYEQHFFRLMGGDGEYDQRTHNYLKQLGFKGVAHWSYSGSDADLDHIKATLKPGMIYLFHTTDKDLPKILSFIPYAKSKGYELVTLNELLGYEDNAVSDISTLNTEMPEPEAYKRDYRETKKGNYSYPILEMQEKLIQLGYLEEGSAEGCFGAQTEKAIGKFQSDHGLEVTGIADTETQLRLFAEAE